MMLYQIVVKRVGIMSGYYYSKPHPVTDDLALAKAQAESARKLTPRPVDVAILQGENSFALEELYKRYISGNQVASTVASDDILREQLEFAPLRNQYPEARYTPRFSDVAWGPAPFQKLLQLMGRVHAGQVGGKDDGQSDD